MPEYLWIDTTKRDELPLFLCDPRCETRDGVQLVRGALVDASGVVLNHDFRIPRREVKKACRAVMSELPRHRVLVPVG